MDSHAKLRKYKITEKQSLIEVNHLKVELEGHHVDITESMRSIATKKFGKFEKRYDRLSVVNIIVKVERNAQCIEAKVRFLGDTISVSSSDKDFYKAIELAAIKLGRSLESRKGHIDTKGREKPPIINADSDGLEPEEYN